MFVGVALSNPPSPVGLEDTKKGTARPLDSFGPERGGSPFFRLAMRARVAYKKSRGCPLFPLPARGLKLITRSGTICSITREATNGQPPFPFRSPFQPQAPEEETPETEGVCPLPVRSECPDEGGVSFANRLSVDIKRACNRTRFVRGVGCRCRSFGIVGWNIISF